MERISDRELQRRLQAFERVWRRVRAAETPTKAPTAAAERCGVKLMPRQGRCRRRG